MLFFIRCLISENEFFLDNYLGGALHYKDYDGITCNRLRSIISDKTVQIKNNYIDEKLEMEYDNICKLPIPNLYQGWLMTKSL